MKQLLISTKCLAQEPLLNAQHNGGLRNFVAVTSLEDERSGQPSDADNDQLKALVAANPCTTVQELASELDIMYMISNHLRLERQKNLINGCLTNWTTTKRNAVMKCHLPFYATRMTRFSTGLRLAMKSGFFTATGDSQLSGLTPKLHNTSRVAPKGHADCLVACDRSHPLVFFNAGENITEEKYCKQMDEMHQT